MRHTLMLHLDPDDAITCREDEDGRLVVEIEGDRGVPFRICGPPDKMAQLYLAIEGHLFNPDEDMREILDGSADRVDIVQSMEALRAAGGHAWDRVDDPAAYLGRADIVPAEAVVDADDLLASMADSFDVRRASWEGDATPAELATGRHNCPEIVP